MLHLIPGEQPNGAAILRKAGQEMDVILHVGAHRTGTTSLQHYLRGHSDALQARGIGVWGPPRTRGGLFSGLLPGPGAAKGRDLRRRAEGRVRMQLANSRTKGVKTLIVSDENMIGTVRANLRSHALYPAIGERMARFNRAFDGALTRVLICPRSLELYWSSLIAYGIKRGHGAPDSFSLKRIALSRRSWRDVITDLACALPDVEIHVLPFESFAGRPDALLREGTGLTMPPDTAGHWLNRAPGLPELRLILGDRTSQIIDLPEGNGRWNPFTPEQTAALRENYQDDMMWLTAGADGLATLTEDRTRTRAGKTLPPGAQTKGRDDDQEGQPLAQSG